MKKITLFVCFVFMLFSPVTKGSFQVAKMSNHIIEPKKNNTLYQQSIVLSAWIRKQASLSFPVVIYNDILFQWISSFKVQTKKPLQCCCDPFFQTYVICQNASEVEKKATEYINVSTSQLKKK